ncbi:MAG: thioredoxin family protein [Microcoleaceae cyanobacterium]
MSQSVIIIQKDSEFETQVLEATTPVLAYFWADWCGPCKLVAPSVESIAENYGDRLKVVKLKVDDNPNAVKTYKVEGVPAIRFFKDKQVIESREGAMTKQQLIDLVEANL